MTSNSGPATRLDAIIVGMGVGGMYQLIKLRELGMSVQGIEAGTDVGGTWYWNRYPGARFDSETHSYCYSFSPELLEEWDWKELFAPQTETYPYLQHVAEKFDVRRHVEFSTRIKRASWDETGNFWTVEAEDGRTWEATYLITAVGTLSIPVVPDYVDRDKFRGPNFHTSEWPRTPFDVTGKRVAVIGTGATGVQVIQEMAKLAGHLTVYQREGNWCKPLRNRPIPPEEMEQIKRDYPAIFERCRSTGAAFIHDTDPRAFADVSPEEREEFYESLYAQPGFALAMGNFSDLGTNEAAARAAGDFLARKIRARVNDPKVADILIPKNHLFGTKRPPMETGYYEVFNQENVDLVDLKATPIERLTEDGIVSGGQERPFDIIIFATGFDSILGAFNRIAFEGRDSISLIEKWRDGPTTNMGMAVHGFPNMLIVNGPHGLASFCNVPRCLEQNVEYVSDLLAYMQEKGFNRVEIAADAEKQWMDLMRRNAEPMLVAQTNSWFTGINTNIEGRTKRNLLFYVGGQVYFQEHSREIAANGYTGFNLSQADSS